MSIKITVGSSKNYSRASTLAGGLICFGLSLMGFYVIISANTLDGGIPFLSQAANTLIGKILFGAGAIFTFVLGLYAFRELLKKKRR